MSAGNLDVYLGSGIIADRPVTPSIPAGMTAWWYATDTSVMSHYNTVDGWADLSAGAASGVELFDSITTTGSATDITFSGIPATAKHLEVVFEGQAAQTGTGTVGMEMIISGITSSNYNHQYLLAAAASVSGGDGSALAYLFCGNVPQNSNAYQRAGYTMRIPSYLKAVPRTIITKGGYYASGPRIMDLYGLLNDATLVTSIKLQLTGGVAFTDGTTADLYGIN